MTYREEPDSLVVSEVDGLPLPTSLGTGEGPGDLGRNADRYLAEGFGEPPYPRTVGILNDAPADLSQDLDRYLAEGFGG